MRIAITGTPGTGKSVLSKKLAKRLGYKLIELNKIIKKEKVYDSYDKKRKCYVVDVKKANKYVKKIKDKNVIIDSHLSHFLDKMDLVIVLRCKPSTLEKRLKKKRWSKSKIEENVESEMISLISWEARQKYKKVFDVDTGKKTSLKAMESIIKGKGSKYKRQINWL